MQILLHDLSVDKPRIMLFRTKKTLMLCSEMPSKKVIYQEGLFRAGANKLCQGESVSPSRGFLQHTKWPGRDGASRAISRCVAIKSHSPSQGNLSLSLLFIQWPFRSKMVKQTDKTIHCYHTGSRCTYNK